MNKKLKQDLPLVVDDDVHLSHMIDEILFFSKEISAKTAIPLPAKVLPLNVLLDFPDDDDGDDDDQDNNTPSADHHPLFGRWIDLERKFAFEKIDGLMLKVKKTCKSRQAFLWTLRKTQVRK